MVYRRSTDLIPPIDHLKQKVITLIMDDGFNESLWVGIIPESTFVVLLSNALIFEPFESMGMIFPYESPNMEALRRGEVITLHPQSFDKYIREGIINRDGIPLIDYQGKLESYRSIYDNGIAVR